MEDNPWTEALVAELRSLVRRQVSYSVIARRLGISRNAAIGKAKRLKILSTDQGGAHDRVWRAPQSCETGPVHQQQSERRALESTVPPRAFRCETIPPAVSSDPLNLRMDQLRFFHCRYITNDDLRDPTYCGRTTAEGTSWCAFHLARVRAPVRSDDVPLVPSLVRLGQSQD